MDINTILIKYKPIIYFHKEEKYFPCDADFFVKNSNLIKNNKIIDTDISQTKLYNTKSDKNTFIQPFNESVKYGYIYHYEDAPLYYFIRDDQIKNKLYIYFFLFFGYNGSYNILNISHIGEHYNDFENFTYEINKTNGLLERIFFSAHGSNEGIWKKSDELEYEQIDNVYTQRPILYCAKNGHGFYPKNGCVIRFFGFANDLTNKGFKYSDYDYIKICKPEDKDFNPEKYGWFYSNIKLGFDGTSSIYKRKYLLEEDKGEFLQKIIPESLYDLSPNITYLFLIIILMFLVERYFSIQDRIKKIMFLTYIFIIFIFVLKLLKETISKI